MISRAPLLKSEMLRRSLRCLALGAWSLIPGLGLMLGVLALSDFQAVVTRKGDRWNAARRHLLAGAWLGGAGILISLGFIAVVVLVILG